MKAREEKLGERWAVWLVAATFILSFFLPAIRLGPPEDRSAPGMMAAVLAAYVLPLAVRALGRGDPGSLYAAFAGVYFTLAWVSNLMMLYLLRVATRGDQGKLERTRRLAVAAAFLCWGALLVDYRRLYAALGVSGEVELYAGYFLWALSFALAAVLLSGWARSRS